MRKITLPLSLINSILIVLFLFVIILPITYWTYLNFETTVQRSVSEYFKQTNNVVQIVIDQERDTLNNIAVDLASDINKKELKYITDEDINSSLSNEISDIDIIFLKYENSTKDFSTSLLDTSSIIAKLNDLNFNNGNIITVRTDETDYSMLVVSKDVVNLKDGRVLGQIVVAKVFNNNFTFVNHIREKSNTKNISLIYDNKIISTSLNDDTFEYKETLKVLHKTNEHNIFTVEDLIFSKQELLYLDNRTKLFVVSSIENSIFKNLEQDFKRQIYLLLVVFIVVSILSYYVVSTIVVKPSTKLLEFAREIQNDESVKYDESIVSEYNYIASGLKNVIGELRDVKERYRLAIDGTHDGLWDWDMKNNKPYFSKSFKEMLGYDEDEALDDPMFWQNSIHEEDKEQAIDNMTTHLKQRSKYYENEYRFKCKDGSFKWVKSRGKALFDKNNRAYRMVGFHTDMQHIKELEKENQHKTFMMFQQAKMASIGDTLGNIAHQWRQPLSIISTIATGIKMKIEFDLFDKKDAIKDLTQLNNSAQSLSKIIDNFRNFYKPNKTKEKFDIKEVVESNIKLMEASNKISGIEIVTNLQETVVYTYKNEFIQAVINILSNATDVLKNEEHPLGNKVIFINLKIKKEQAVLKIYDTGGGINEEIEDKIYEPYFTTKHKYQEAGLGLFMSKEIIEKHLNGTISNRNILFNYMDKTYNGAEFTITLPLK